MRRAAVLLIGGGYSVGRAQVSGLPNTTEVTYSPEASGVYIGSPSIIKCVNGSYLAAHDHFGANANTAYLLRSDDQGHTWHPTSQVPSMYWASLFTRAMDGPSNMVYLMGTTSDSTRSTSEVSLARSPDCGVTWTQANLTKWQHDISTGPTPVLEHAGRLWRAYERNDGPWASGYASFVASAAADAGDLLDPAAWTMSDVLDFASVSSRVPANWTNPLVQSSFGWLEGNAVAPPSANDTGVYVVLRVNSNPTANKAALLNAGNATAAPQFVQWLDFPGGMTKFTIRRDNATGLYVSLTNTIRDDRVTAPPVCMDASMPPVLPAAAMDGAVGGTAPLPCCNMQEQLACGAVMPSCVWCHTTSRNNLTLVVSADLISWRVVETVMTDDSGLPEWARQIWVGFQYVDFQFEGADIIAVVRAAYRGAQTYHNSNRLLFQRITQWRQRVDAAS